MKSKTPIELRKEILESNASQKSAALKSAIIVDGFQLTMIQESDELKRDFVDLTTFERVEVVLCCRVSP